MTPPDDPAMRAMLSDATARLQSDFKAKFPDLGKDSEANDAKALEKSRAQFEARLPELRRLEYAEQLAAARAEGKREGLEEAAGIPEPGSPPPTYDGSEAWCYHSGWRDYRAAIRARIEETT